MAVGAGAFGRARAALRQRAPDPAGRDGRARGPGSARARFARLDGALFAAAQLARLTGDRTRDLDDETRALVLAALSAADARLLRRMVTEVTALEAADKARALGDTLPVGLSLA